MKKKLVLLNVVCNGSTGRIMKDIAKYSENEYETYCFYGRGTHSSDINAKKFGNKLEVYFHVFLTRIFSLHGHGSYFSTKKMVKHLRKINPDIIHLHNIHGYWLNLNVLFKYLKKEFKGKIIWTLHDCWTFTGKCAHFTLADCQKWQSGCFNCPQKKEYPRNEIFDTSKKEYKLKKELFTGLHNLTITVPSNWLKLLVEKSFLKDYPVEVINNGVNLNIFKPTKTVNIFEKYNIPQDKKIILGVANVWENKKGLNIFYDLAQIINKDMIIVLAGLNESQIKKLPKQIIGIRRTENLEELANLYTYASVFVNPSVEETFSLVTIEAMSCGTPLVVCNKSATKDLIEKNTGYVVNNHDVDDYYKLIQKVLSKDKKYYEKYLLKTAKKYENENMLNNFLKLYRN